MEAFLQHRRDKGFLMVEWLAGIFVCGILSLMLFAGVSSFQRILAIEQMNGVARDFAQDIMRVQERALNGYCLGYIELFSSRKGYRVYRRPNLVEKKRDFALAGSGTFRFSSVPSNIIRFSVNGVPSANGIYILQHEKYPSIKVNVSLQPVTGRVQIERVR